MASPSPSPSPKPSFRSRVGTVMRRSSSGLGLGVRRPEPGTTLPDSAAKGSNLKVSTALEPQITPHADADPVPESPAREAEASRPSPIVAPSPLGVIPDHHPHETPTPVPRVPLESTGAEQDIEVLTASNASGSGSRKLPVL